MKVKVQLNYVYVIMNKCKLTTKLYISKCGLKITKFVVDLFGEHGKLKSWSVLNMEYNLNNTFYFWWLQLTDVIKFASQW